MFNKDRFEIISCICCWYDLLGFGTPFVDAKWDLKNEIAEKSINRIVSESDFFSGVYSNAYGKKMHLNDGIVSNYDFNEEKSDYIKELLFYLDGILIDFKSLNAVELRNDFPGARGVITLGQRVCYDNTNTTYLVSKQEDVCYHPHEFQMNTAFSKAFIVEESGSAKGICGPNLYIDYDIIKMINGYSCGDICYKITEKTHEDTINMTIFRNNISIASLSFDANIVQYQNRGIDTWFYKLKESNTIMDDWAAEKEFQRARQIAMIESEDQE